MKRKAWRILGVCVIACMTAIVLLSGVKGGCTSMIDTAAGGVVPMKCLWAFRAEALVGCLGLLSSFATMLARSKDARRVGAALTLAVFVVAMLVLTPLGIGICSGDGTHACQTTANGIWVVSAVGAILSLVQLAKATPARISRVRQ